MEEKGYVLIVRPDGTTVSLDDLCDEQDKKGLLDIKSLNVEDRIVVETKNSIYEFILKSLKVEVLVRGGKRQDGSIRFPEWSKAFINGSTWGGSMLKVGYFGIDMHLEFVVENKPGVMLTSPVKSITVVNTLN